jgi:hypothetical protein
MLGAAIDGAASMIGIVELIVRSTSRPVPRRPQFTSAMNSPTQASMSRPSIASA